MHPHVAILTTTGEALATGVERKRVNRTEMTLHAANLLFKNSVEKSSLEGFFLSLRCDIHR